MYDFIIVGGGTSGSILAARLSEDARVRVLLVEAGPRDMDPYIHLPVGFFRMTGGPLTWGYRTAAQRHAGNRVAVYPQARVLGGGSSINAEVFTRGCPEDYDNWAKLHGCDGWDYASLRPYFVKSEGNRRFGGSEHGVDGPLTVSDQPNPSRLSLAYVQACMDFGMPYNADFNGGRQEGAGLYQAFTRDGRRCSAATAYLRPAMTRPNLTVWTDCFVARVVIEKGRAKGIELAEGSALKRIDAGTEVIVAAGAIGSPKLLMLSGIGPAAHLREKGVSVLHDLPGVGENLHDHVSTDVIWEVNGPHSYDRYRKPHWKLWAGLQYFMFRTGPVASNIVEAGAFWWSDRGEKTPDLQFHFLPGAGIEAGVGAVPGGNGATCNSYQTRPRSRGHVRLLSPNPADPPEIDPNVFAEPYDLDRHVDAVRITQEVGRMRSLRPFIDREIFPGPDCRSHADYENAVRRNCRSSYHPVGTCRMGKDERAVVDPHLRLRGIDGLRVADSSVMPQLVSSNTNAPTAAIAEKAAALILGNR